MTTRMNMRTWSRPWANVRDSGGPVRVSSEEPPEGWEPKPFLGFTNNHREKEDDDGGQDLADRDDGPSCYAD